MGKVLEIRWHGRGGQGAKTAALLLAQSAFELGKHIQGFPEYGPERMGAPVTAYNRISDEPISIHSNIYEPDVVVVIDDTLIGKADVTSGLDVNKAIIVNSEKNPEDIRKKLNFSGKIYTVDANQISIETLGQPFPNTPMMGAVVKVTGMMKFDEFYNNMKVQLESKFANKPEVIDGNLNAIERAYQEVKG
jgi:pyruvate ferredoxin oxidoreductase gamma subunit